MIQIHYLSFPTSYMPAIWVGPYYSFVLTHKSPNQTFIPWLLCRGLWRESIDPYSLGSCLCSIPWCYRKANPLSTWMSARSHSEFLTPPTFPDSDVLSPAMHPKPLVPSDLFYTPSPLCSLMAESALVLLIQIWGIRLILSVQSGLINLTKSSFKAVQ